MVKDLLGGDQWVGDGYEVYDVEVFVNGKSKAHRVINPSAIGATPEQLKKIVADAALVAHIAVPGDDINVVLTKREQV